MCESGKRKEVVGEVYSRAGRLFVGRLFDDVSLVGPVGRVVGMDCGLVGERVHVGVRAKSLEEIQDLGRDVGVLDREGRHFELSHKRLPENW